MPLEIQRSFAQFQDVNLYTLHSSCWHLAQDSYNFNWIFWAHGDFWSSWKVKGSFVPCPRKHKICSCRNLAVSHILLYYNKLNVSSHLRIAIKYFFGRHFDSSSFFRIRFPPLGNITEEKKTFSFFPPPLFFSSILFPNKMNAPSPPHK